MIKAFIFDAGGVLIDNPWPGMQAHYAKHLGVKEEAFATTHEKYAYEYMKGHFKEDEYWKLVCGELHVSTPKIPLLWREGIAKAWSEKKEVFSVIAKLKEKRYKIGLLSNTELPSVPHFQEKKYPHFDVVVLSCLEGMIKPDKEIYELTVKRLAITPQEALFIDDKKENVEGAKKVGLHAIHFTDVHSFKKGIRKHSNIKFI